VTRERIAAIGAFVLVVAGAAVGFATIGPPQHVRLVELDRRRVNDLQGIESALRIDSNGHRPGFQKVPERADADWPRDPGTHRPYDYRRESATAYRLCATFALPSDDADEAHWRHGAGRTCYRLDVTTTNRPVQGQIYRATF
jgi:hypothetical protein